MSGVVVRPATVADAEAIAGCQTVCWEQAYRGLVDDAYLDRTGVAERLPRWRERLRAGDRGVWVAVAGPTTVGVVSSGPSRDDPPVRDLELMSLYTHAATHGTGLGTRLLRAAIGTAPASLWVFAANVRARAFYAKHGFAPDGAEALDDGTGLREVRLVR